MRKSQALLRDILLWYLSLMI